MRTFLLYLFLEILYYELGRLRIEHTDSSESTDLQLL